MKDFGRSKSGETISYIAETIREFDVTAIIEVVAGRGGPEAVERLVDSLRKDGTNWRYVISNPTTSVEHGTERYAYVWKGDKLRLVGSWLEEQYAAELDREPFFITFAKGRKNFTLAVFHAVPTAKHPENEIPLLKDLVEEYPDKDIIFCADFNLSQAHPAFDVIKNNGYEPIFENQKTSLRTQCHNDDCLASEYDNIFYRPQRIHYTEGGIIPFYEGFRNIQEARAVSDHIPVYFQFSLN